MSLADFLTSRLALETLGWTLIHFIWQGAAIALGLAMALLLCPQRLATLRYTLSCTAMTLLIAIPCFTFSTLYNPNDTAIRPADIRQMALQNQPQHNRAQSNNTLSNTSHDTPNAHLNPTSQTDHTQRASQPNTLWQTHIHSSLNHVVRWLPYFWFLGILVLSLRLITGWSDVQTLKRQRAYPVASQWKKTFEHLKTCLNIKQAVLLLESASVSSPMVIGWVKPVILMPTSTLLGLTPQQIEAIILHELAHIKRYDYLVNWIQVLIEICLFYHPAVWWISNRIRIEREHCCDDITLQHTPNALSYARALAQLETQRTLSVAASDGILLHRIRRLLNKPTAKPPFQTASLFSLIGISIWALFTLTAPLPAHNTHAQATLVLKQMCLDQDFEGAYRTGKELIKKHPKSAELFAWYICALTRYRYTDLSSPPAEEITHALSKARIWIKHEPDNGWAKFALAIGATHLGRQVPNHTISKTLFQEKHTLAREAHQISKRLLAQMPHNLDAYWLYCETLNNHNTPEKTLHFLKTETLWASHLQTHKGDALLAHYQHKKSTPTLTSAIVKELKSAIEMHSQNAHLHLNLAHYLAHIEQYQAAYAYFKKAVQLSPNANTIRAQHWQNIQQIQSWRKDQQHAKIETDITQFLNRRGHYPGALLTIHDTYAQLGKTHAQAKIKNRLLNEFPNSQETETLLFRAINAQPTHVISTNDLAQLRQYIARPQHYNTAYLGKVYYAYWQALSKRTNTSAQERLAAIKGLLRYHSANTNTLIECALALSNHTEQYPLAVSVAKQAIAQKHTMPYNRSPLYKTQQDTLLSQAFDALGWAYLKMGRKKAAIRELVRAQLFVNNLPRNLYHLGQEAELSGDYREAETFYLTGISKNPHPTNPNHRALKELEHLMASK